MYDLSAAVHHSGSANGGHYIAFVRTTDDGWMCYNDANVFSVSVDKVLTAGAYILLYEKRRGTSGG